MASLAGIMTCFATENEEKSRSIFWTKESFWSWTPSRLISDYDSQFVDMKQTLKV